MNGTNGYAKRGETYDLEFLMNIQESDIAFYPDAEDVEKIRLQAELCANADDEKDYKYQWLTIQRECSLLAFNLYKRHLRFTVPRERYYQRIIHKFYPDICGP